MRRSTLVFRSLTLLGSSNAPSSAFFDHADRRIQALHSRQGKAERAAGGTESRQSSTRPSRARWMSEPASPIRPTRTPEWEWFGGRCRSNWEVRRLKTLAEMQSGDAITAMSIEETGEYPVFGANGLRGYSSHYTHDGAFALIGRQGALCGNVHLARGRFWASEHAVVATLARGHVIEWFCGLLAVMNLNQYSIAAAQPGLSVDRVLNLWAPVPPIEEQEAISQSVVERSHDLENALAATQRQIALLREYRTRLIADVVTGKLDVREAAADLPETDSLARNRDRASIIPTESNLHSSTHDMAKEAIT